MRPKIVRDRIPEIILASGKIPKTQIVSRNEAISGLEAKLQEELNEYLADRSLEEMADILEVMHGILYQLDIAWDELEAVRRKKYAERGGFHNRVLLMEIESNDAGK